MKVRNNQPIRWGLVALAAFWMFVVVPLSAAAAPYAALVMDARSGKVLYSRNADARLHPASLTKMMTLYIAFEAIENGEISLDDQVTISKNAAREPPSKLGMRAGQKIKLRYLIRAAAVKSANDAATAIGEAIEGSEAGFSRRMNRTAQALGMTKTTFKNAHGLTQSGHLSSARDMTVLGRQLFFDYPDYYNLFSRLSADAGIRTVRHTNRRLLRSYKGADGIKTGYTSASGFNLVASAQHGNERIIATVFGGRSTATRNAKVAELLDLGFRKAATRVALNRPARPAYLGPMNNGNGGVAGRTVRLAAAAAVKKSLRPQMRPAPDPPKPAAPVIVTAKADIQKAILAASQAEPAAESAPASTDLIAASAEQATPIAEIAQVNPQPRPQHLQIATAADAVDNRPEADPVQEVVTRVSTSGGRNWGINVGRYPSQYAARKILLRTALSELDTLDGSLRKVVHRSNGYDANFLGITRETADLACRRLQAKNLPCFMVAPG